MSYNVSLKVNTGLYYTEVEGCGNYTYNVSPMYYDVLQGGLKSISPLKASIVAIQLEGAISKLEADPYKYIAMEPINKWGDYKGALQFLKTIRAACLNHPVATVFVT